MAALLLLWAIGPAVPAAHAVPAHDACPVLEVNWPLRQSLHVTAAMTAIVGASLECVPKPDMEALPLVVVVPVMS